MNRLILIGNGFDIAHGMETGYASFLNYLLDQQFSLLKTEIKNPPTHSECIIEIVNDLQIGKEYHVLDKIMLEMKSFSEFKDSKIVNYKINNKILELCQSDSKWLDIELTYYRLLIESLNPLSDFSIGQLNRDLDFIKKKLIHYLSSQESDFNKKFKGDPDYHDFIRRLSSLLFAKVKYDEVSEEYFSSLISTPGGQDEKYYRNFQLIDSQSLFNDKNLGSIGKTILLNFNYTNTPVYYKEFRSNEVLKLVHIPIHGTIKNEEENPVIFGYGDDLDEDYKKLEIETNLNYLKNSKAINYLNSNEYKKLLRFLNLDDFQVSIIGHSCGRSDRTLLNTIFEHKNCVSVKPFYYIKKNGEDNYSDIVSEISKSFKDKHKFRDRVVNKTFTTSIN